MPQSCPAVAQISNPQTGESPSTSEPAAACRMEFGDTADWKSALRIWWLDPAKTEALRSFEPMRRRLAGDLKL